MSDESQQAGVKWLSKLLTLVNMSAAVSSEMKVDEAGQSCWLTIDENNLEDKQVEVLLGKNGAVLDSIQYLANTTLNLHQPSDLQQAFTVDVAGYRERRYEELKAIAAHAAEEARSTGQEFEIPSLSSAERRQVHNFLKAYDGLETFSRGKEPHRCLVVRLADLED